MRCTFLPITEPDERGRRAYQCSREGCKLKTAPTPYGPDRIFATCKVKGWGDRLAFWLAVFGITKKRVEWVTRKPCGCEERAAKLNTLGESLTARLRLWWG
jgi:hypothetical protein